MKPLEGLLVVAIEQAVAAPLCSSRLAAAGARVIKIERGEGDFARKYDQAAKGESSYFTWLNQGKESMCLDFKTPSGADTLRTMLKEADVLLQNLSPGALARAGFTREALHQLNPELVICNIAGYATNTPAAEKRAYDLLIQAESGMIAVSGSPGHAGRIGVSICDIGAGMTAYSGILEALLQRGLTGRGEEISVSLFDVAAEWMSVPYTHAHYGRGTPQPIGLRHPSIAPYGAFACADGRQVLVAVQNEREWARFCSEALRQPSLVQDARFGSNNLRVEHREALEETIQQHIETLNTKELMARLDTANIAFGSINSAKELGDHSALRLASYTGANGETVKLPANPLQQATPPAAKSTRAPSLGEHTKALLAEFGHSHHG